MNDLLVLSPVFFTFSFSKIKKLNFLGFSIKIDVEDSSSIEKNQPKKGPASRL